jgi:DNA-binding MarR family transcriptional regulator
MGGENEVLVKEIVAGILRLYRAVYLDSLKTSKRFGLTGSQSAVLRAILAHGALSSAELSRKLCVTPSNITGVIDRLEKKGLVERVRQREDRRVVLITLTESGKELSKQLPDPIERKLISGLVDLGPEQVHALSDAMNRIVDLISAERIEETDLGGLHEHGPWADEKRA